MDRDLPPMPSPARSPGSPSNRRRRRPGCFIGGNKQMSPSRREMHQVDMNVIVRAHNNDGNDHQQGNGNAIIYSNNNQYEQSHSPTSREVGFALDLPGTVDGLLHAPPPPSCNNNDDQGSEEVNAAGQTAGQIIPSALTYENRMRSLSVARDTFRHDDTTAHDDEVRAGAVEALIWRLGYAVGMLSVCRGTEDNDDDDDILPQPQIWSELAEITTTLAQIYKCSQSARMQSFESVGQSQLLRLLIHMMGAGLDDVLFSSSSSSHQCIIAASGAILSSLRVLRSYAKVSNIRPQLLNGRSLWVRRLLGFLARLLSFESIRLQTEVLGLLKDVTHRCSDSEAHLVVEYPNLVKIALLAVSDKKKCSTMLSRNDEYVATLLWNLASIRSVRRVLVSLGEGDDTGVLGVLLRMISCEGNDLELDVTWKDVQKAALSALGNLARGGGSEANEANSENGDLQDDDACILAILSHDNGSVLFQLLSIAIDGPGSSNVACRRRAVRTIRCLVRDWKTSSKRPLAMEIASKRDINLSTELSQIMTNDDDVNVRVQAAESMALLYQSLSEKRRKDDPDFEAMKAAFFDVIISSGNIEKESNNADEEISNEKDTRCAEIACNALSALNTHTGELEKRSNMLPVLLRLLDMKTFGCAGADNVNDKRLAALKLLHELSKDESNRDIMLAPLEECSDEQQKHQDSVGSTSILNALAEMLGTSDGSNDGVVEMARAELRGHAAGIIVELSRNSSPKERALLDHPSLLANFMSYCTTSLDGPVKDETKKAALRLVASL